LKLTVPGGGWNFNFDYFPASNGNPAFYLFSSGSLTAGTRPAPTPEPGTLALMATGLIGLAAVIRKEATASSLIWTAGLDGFVDPTSRKSGEKWGTRAMIHH